VTNPNTSTLKWGIGTQQLVTWNTNLGAADNVRLVLSTNGGTSFPITLLASTANDKSDVVTVPNNPTVLARIRVEWIANPSVKDPSNANFQIAAPFVTVAKPNGGEIWVRGTNQTFLWTSNLGAKEFVRIELSTRWRCNVGLAGTSGRGSPNPESVLIASTPSDGTQAIRLPLVTSTKCRARITWLDNPVIDTSNANFIIRAP
jgi:hypothetical protein